MHDPQRLVSDWLDAAGRKVRVGLCVTEDGHCRILLDEGDCCVVEVPPGSELVYFYLAVRRLAEDADEANRELRQALKLNAFGIETGCCSFSYDPRSEHLVLTRSARIDGLNDESFCAVLDDFIGSALWAKSRFEEEMRQVARPAYAALSLGELDLSRA
jgi:hypothetical protein